MIEFELGLESELRHLLDPVVATRAPRRRSRQPYRAGFRLLSAMALGCLLVGMGIEATIRRSLNPIDWTGSVSQQLGRVQSNGRAGSRPHQNSAPATNHSATAPPGATQAPGVPALPKVAPVPVPTVTAPPATSVP